jgi:hypothetical protein
MSLSLTAMLAWHYCQAHSGYWNRLSLPPVGSARLRFSTDVRFDADHSARGPKRNRAPAARCAQDACDAMPGQSAPAISIRRAVLRGEYARALLQMSACIMAMGSRRCYDKRQFRRQGNRSPGAARIGDIKCGSAKHATKHDNHAMAPSVNHAQARGVCRTLPIEKRCLHRPHGRSTTTWCNSRCARAESSSERRAHAGKFSIIGCCA